METEESIGDRLASIMKQKNISRTQLMDLTGLDRPTLYRIEKGENKNPKLDTIRRICDALNISSDWLLFGKGIIEARSVSMFANAMTLITDKLSDQDKRYIFISSICFGDDQRARLTLENNIYRQCGNHPKRDQILQQLMAWLEERFKLRNSYIEAKVINFMREAGTNDEMSAVQTILSVLDSSDVKQLDLLIQAFCSLSSEEADKILSDFNPEL